MNSGEGRSPTVSETLRLVRAQLVKWTQGNMEWATKVMQRTGFRFEQICAVAKQGT